MDESVKSEILFHILNECEQQVDSRQILNHVRETKDGYILRVYGKTLKFNKDGDMV